MKKLLILLCIPLVSNAGTNYLKDGTSYLYVDNEKSNVIDCTIDQLCEIVLLPNDNAVNWIMADGTAWRASTDANMGYVDNTGTKHIYIQSAEVTKGNNQVILVGKTHQYKFLLKASKKSLTNKYVFLQDTKSKQDTEEIVDSGGNFKFDMDNIDTRYYTTGDTDAYFNPVKIFNNGENTYIEMPKSLKNYEKPVLKVFSSQGRLEEAPGCIYRKPYYQCNGLLSRLALVVGSVDNPDEKPLRINIWKGEKPSFWKKMMQQYDQ